MQRGSPSCDDFKRNSFQSSFIPWAECNNLIALADSHLDEVSILIHPLG